MEVVPDYGLETWMDIEGDYGGYELANSGQALAVLRWLLLCGVFIQLEYVHLPYNDLLELCFVLEFLFLSFCKLVWTAFLCLSWNW